MMKNIVNIFEEIQDYIRHSDEVSILDAMRIRREEQEILSGTI